MTENQRIKANLIALAHYHRGLLGADTDNSKFLSDLADRFDDAPSMGDVEHGCETGCCSEGVGSGGFNGVEDMESAGVVNEGGCGEIPERLACHMDAVEGRLEAIAVTLDEVADALTVIASAMVGRTKVQTGREMRHGW